MKFLFIYTQSSISDLKDALISSGHSVFSLEHIYFDPNTPLSDQNTILEQNLRQNHYDYVISYLFIPSVADICFRLKFYYISWVYDSPQNALFKPEIMYPTNRLFVFDLAECYHLRDLGVSHVYHLPLSANINRIQNLTISAADELAFAHDIAFIGGIYDNNYYDLFLPYFPKKVQNELKQVLSQICCNWSAERSWLSLSHACSQFLADVVHTKDWNGAPLLPDELYAYLVLVPKKAAQIERVSVLNTLAAFFSVDLYTWHPCPYLQNVSVHPSVNYYTDACKIFALSKINLNLTLPSIESGVPQRIFDIMASGGFVITNYQSELEDLFTIGEDLEVFHDIPELIAKCRYYLSHEKERLSIALNGYQKVRSLHTYDHRITKILDILSKETGDTNI